MNTTHLPRVAIICLAPLLWAASGPAAAACTGGPDLFVCLYRADYVAQLQALTADTFVEGFENDAVWGDARTTGTATRPAVNTQPSVTSRGIVWTTNHPLTNGISTSAGAARTGSWGVYDPKHGSATGSVAGCDIDNPPEPCLFHDGVTGTLLDGEPRLLGAGGYFSGFAGANVAVALDGGAPLELTKLTGAGRRFMGVIRTSGFRRFQFREMDGKIGQALLVFADDFTFGAASPRDLVGVRSGSRFKLDYNANDRWDGTAGGDVAFSFGVSTDLPVSGDWNGDGIGEVGVWRPGTQSFMLDLNATDHWDRPAGGDISYSFGAAGDVPVTGDWNGDGIDEIGVWRPGSRRFYLDANGSGTWDWVTGGDILTPTYGESTDFPFAGDWNGDGIDEVGVWRPRARRFYLDANGSGTWDGAAGGDTVTAPFGESTDLPVAGDWNGDGIDDIGVWRPVNRKFYLDANGSGTWDRVGGGDILTARFGVETDTPVRGRW